MNRGRDAARRLHPNIATPLGWLYLGHAMGYAISGLRSSGISVSIMIDPSRLKDDHKLTL